VFALGQVTRSPQLKLDLHQGRLGQGVSAEAVISDLEQPIDDLFGAVGATVGPREDHQLLDTVAYSPNLHNIPE
jgi:hypothetical protein